MDTDHRPSAFDRAADYDRHAGVQRQVAVALAARIARLPLAEGPRVLEVGCGTGFLGEALMPHLPDARWVMTDIAPTMLERASARLAGHLSAITFAQMDGELPDQPGPNDLVCSSLAVQWFADLPAALERLRGTIAPGGWLAFTTLVDGSFAEWRDAHEGLSCGVSDYPSAAALARLGLHVEVTRWPVRFDGGMGFLRHLKGIGANTPRPGHRPLTPRQLRQVMARFAAGGGVASYCVATCIAGPA